MSSGRLSTAPRFGGANVRLVALQTLRTRTRPAEAGRFASCDWSYLSEHSQALYERKSQLSNSEGKVSHRHRRRNGRLPELGRQAVQSSRSVGLRFNEKLEGRDGCMAYDVEPQKTVSFKRGLAPKEGAQSLTG